MTKPPDPFGEDDEELDDDTVAVHMSNMIRVLGVYPGGPRRKCGGNCGDWIKIEEKRTKVILLFPEEADRIMENAGSYQSPGSAPMYYCVSCMQMAEQDGYILIEPEEPT